MAEDLQYERTRLPQENPSGDYWKIMDSCFTGYNRDDEKIVEQSRFFRPVAPPAPGVLP